MRKKLTDAVIKISKPIFFFIFAAAFIVIQIIFTLNMPELTKLTEGFSILDMSIGYSADTAYEHFQSYQKASDVYFRIRTADFFFPAVYAFILSIISVFIYRRKYDNVDNYRWVLCVPFVGAAFDYAENIMLVILYRLLPSTFSAPIYALNIFTILKYGLLAFSILLIVTGALSLIKGTDSAFINQNKFRGKR